MIPRIPITQVKPDLSDALHIAVREIKRFPAAFYPVEAIEQTSDAQAIAGQWRSRIKGFLGTCRTINGPVTIGSRASICSIRPGHGQRLVINALS